VLVEGDVGNFAQDLINASSPTQSVRDASKIQLRNN